MNAKYALLFLTLLTLFSGCKKDDNDFESNTLLGTWEHREPSSAPNGKINGELRIRYYLKPNANYSFRVDYYGIDSPRIDELTGWTEINGSYEVELDSVYMRNEEIEYWSKLFGPTVKTELVYKQDLNSRFQIANNVLTLDYISYPAEAPIKTQMNYKRVD